MAKQRIFKIREHLLAKKTTGSTQNPVWADTGKPIPEVVWMRYNLTLAAVNKKFNSTEDLFDYIIELEDFIFSAGDPGVQGTEY